MADTSLNVKEAEQFNTDEEDFDTVMTSDITFKGNITFDKPFFIKGKVSGHIQSASDLLVDTEAVVEADIVSDSVYVRGKVFGNIDAVRLIYVTSSGMVKGDICAKQVVLEPGSVFSGRCTMREDNSSALRSENV